MGYTVEVNSNRSSRMRPLLGSSLYLLRDPCGVSTMTSTSISGSLGGPHQAYPATYRSHKRHLELNNPTYLLGEEERGCCDCCDWRCQREELAALDANDSRPPLRHHLGRAGP